MMVRYLFLHVIMSISPTYLGVVPVSTFGGSISDKEGQEVEDDKESDSAELST
jgi:hypothetical protein